MKSIGIIGGADGPTAIYISSSKTDRKTNRALLLCIGTGISAALSLCVVLFRLLKRCL
ncbi:MAG TPA: hypothetical protein IAA80_09030 [Candidatus Gallacutalibacter pullistercoris]|nr:hypothetical protein [Candidatus Gallacutalibacter pullistercoris]